jgi:3-oxoacyl-[acyl-carrier protein] reductase
LLYPLLIIFFCVSIIVLNLGINYQTLITITLDLNLRNKNALVCGSSRGIGRAAATEIAKLGANVTLVARTADSLEDVRKDLDTSLGQKHDFIVADFADLTDLKKRVRNLTSVKTIHILINNTGGPPGGPITEAKLEEFTTAFSNHLLCNHILVQAVTPGMKKENYGRIINVISTSVREPIDNLGVSNTTRGAVANWAKTMSKELGPFAITVNNVLPGYTETDRLKEIIKARASKSGQSEEATADAMKSNVPLRRFANPNEVGGVIAFLTTPAAAYINGTNVTVDGGRTKSH